MSDYKRQRIDFLEYKLLYELYNKIISIEFNNIKEEWDFKTDKKPVPNAFKAAEELFSRNLIKENGELTEKGVNYLNQKPWPKIKYDKLTPLNKKETGYLKALYKSKYNWTSGTRVAEKSWFLFRLVRHGYAVGSIDHGINKLNKNDIMPKPELFYPENRYEYHFRINKKGIKFLEDKNLI